MESEWVNVPLKDLTSKITKGTTPSKSDGGFSVAGVNYIRAESVSYDSEIDVSTFKHVSAEVHEKLKRSQLSENDILFSMAGAYLGKTGIVQRSHLPANTNQALALIRPKLDLIDPNYLLYFLRQKTVVHFVMNSVSQSAQPNINLQEIGNINISLPDIYTQGKISSVIASLDNKIQLNRQTNQTLEQMAQALFKSWFVDFDPVVDNALAAGNPIPEPFAKRAEVRRTLLDKTLPEEQRALFPSEFEETGLSNSAVNAGGWVPKGWGLTCLGEHTNLTTGASFQSKDFLSEGVKLARGDNVKEGCFYWGHKTRFWDADDHAMRKHELLAGDTLLAMDGSKVGKNRVRVTASDLPCLLVQRVACLRPKNSISSGFIYLLINSQRLRDYVEIVKTGSAIPHISGKQIKDFPLILPVDNRCPVIHQFNEKVDSLFSRIDSNVAETKTLSSLRDTLLPKLISGELRLPETDSVQNKTSDTAA
jgi:type I restriction enzyme S subunit